MLCFVGGQLLLLLHPLSFTLLIACTRVYIVLRVISTVVATDEHAKQEKPTGGRTRVREDLLKKFATGEGIAGRMPYAILTKQFNIIGWKRMEMNRLIQFDDVTEENFEAIMRRIALIKKSGQVLR